MNFYQKPIIFSVNIIKNTNTPPNGRFVYVTIGNKLRQLHTKRHKIVSYGKYR